MMRLLTIALTILMLGLLPGRVELAPDSVTTPESPEPPKRCYAVLFTTGPRFTHEPGAEGLPGFGAHVKYIKSMYADGVVKLAGPLFEDEEMKRLSGALYFVFAENLEEARAVVMNEPLVQEHVAEISSISLFVAAVGTLD